MPRDVLSWRDVWTARLVWGVWAVLTVAAIGLILALGADIPFADDWSDLVPTFAGVRPVDAWTLWRPHNEHHVLLPRLLLIGLGHATNYDFRAGALFSAGALSAASALLLHSARGVDGRLRLADCALPLLLLNWGHYMTLFWSYQVHAALLVLLACVLFVIIARYPESPPFRAIAVFGVCLLALPLCQAGGVALAPVLALWCVAVGVRDSRSPSADRRRRGWAALAVAAAAVALAAVAFVPPDHSTAGDPVRALWWSAVVLSTGFGVTERESQLLTLVLPVAAATIFLASAVLLVRVTRSQPRERLRAAGFGLYLLAFLGLAVGIAWGRQVGSLSHRYPALAAPLLCGIYLAWRRYGSVRSPVCATLCAALVLLLPWNTAAGLRFVWQRAEVAAAFERDVHAGASIDELASRYAGAVHPKKGVLLKCMRFMRDAQIGVFRPH